MNRRIENLRRNYGKLSHIERFRLVVAARCRGDHNEVEILMQTAPRAVYSDVATPFTGMIRGLELVTLAVVIDVLNAGVGLMSVLAIGNTWVGEEAASTAIAESAKQVVAVWNSLDLFCQRVGVSRLDAIKLAPCPPVIAGLTELARLLVVGDEDRQTAQGKPEDAATAPIPIENEISEMAEEYATLLQKIWEREAAVT